ncbi:hypothetical protein EQV77_13490 [Halobacillus fulvus]|nr:hypothetical protein EQV77_13490 [Halobacillus fulvus]
MEMKQTAIQDEGLKKRFPFSKKQTGLLTMMGIGFWFLGALSVRFGSQVGLFGPVSSILAFGLGLAVAWFGVKLIVAVCRLAVDQIVPGVAFGLAVATFLTAFSSPGLPLCTEATGKRSA